MTEPSSPLDGITFFDVPPTPETLHAARLATEELAAARTRWIARLCVSNLGERLTPVEAIGAWVGVLVASIRQDSDFVTALATAKTPAELLAKMGITPERVEQSRAQIDEQVALYRLGEMGGRQA